MSEATVPVFLSWSGEPSKMVAQALEIFIGDCIQASTPWISDNIHKGEPWSEAILSKLQPNAIGIVCVTKANQASPWLLFEGGALAKHKSLHVFLIDAKPSDIQPPLGLYQHTAATREDVLKLLAAIDARVPAEQQRGSERLKRLCDKNWPELEAAIEHARSYPTEQPSERPARELLEEILTTVRGLADTSVKDEIRVIAREIIRQKDTLNWARKSLAFASRTREIPPPDAEGIALAFAEEQAALRTKKRAETRDR